jgi:hypothetical protein
MACERASERDASVRAIIGGAGASIAIRILH